MCGRVARVCVFLFFSLPLSHLCIARFDRILNRDPCSFFCLSVFFNLVSIYPGIRQDWIQLSRTAPCTHRSNALCSHYISIKRCRNGINMKINLMAYKTGKHAHRTREHIKANQNRSKMESVCVQYVRLLFNVPDAGVENGKMACIWPQKMKLSKLIFEFFSSVSKRAFHFKFQLAPRNRKHAHCILIRSHEYCPQCSPIHFNYMTSRFIFHQPNKFTNHLSTFILKLVWTIEISVETMSTIHVCIWSVSCVVYLFENSITIH